MFQAIALGVVAWFYASGPPMGSPELGCGVDGLALVPDGPVESAVDLRAISRGLKQVNTKLFHDISERHKANNCDHSTGSQRLPKTSMVMKEWEG